MKNTIEQKINHLIEDGLSIYIGVKEYLDVPENLLVGIEVSPTRFITENSRGAIKALREDQIVLPDWDKVIAEYLYVVYDGIAIKMKVYEVFFGHVDHNGETGYVYQTTVYNSPSSNTYFYEEKDLHINNPLQSEQPMSAAHILNL